MTVTNAPDSYKEYKVFKSKVLLPSIKELLDKELAFVDLLDSKEHAKRVDRKITDIKFKLGW